MEPFVHSAEHFLEQQKWRQLAPYLRVGITTKSGGVSKGRFSSFNCGLHVQDVKEDVIENRNKLAESIDFPLDKWVCGEQVHDVRIHEATISHSGKGSQTVESSLTGVDGIFTKEKGILLTAFFADCIPLYYFDPIEEIIGITHAGWKGTVKGIAKEMVEKFLANGSKPENILVTIGPGISQKYYEVDEYVVSHIEENFRKKTLRPKENGRFLLDLKALNREILLQYGILRHNIDMTNYCTYRDEEIFFSYRRDEGKTGRMLGFIGMQK